MGSILAVVMCYVLGMMDITPDSAQKSANVSTLQTMEKNPYADGPLPSKRCGRNGLFMFLRQLGYDAPYSQIEQYVPMGPAGSSLLELRNAAGKLGVQLTIYKCEPTYREATSLPPCLALIRTRPQGEGAEETIFRGHYVLVERARRVGAVDKIDFIDGSYGTRQTLPIEEFASIWTGYFLASSNSPWASWLRGASVAGVISLLGFCLWLFRRHAGQPGCLERHNGPATSIGMIIAALAVASPGNCVFGGENAPGVDNKYDSRDGSWKAWRIPERDAINDLYILLQCCGIDHTYQEVVGAFGGDERKRNLLEIRDAARALGMKVSIYRCTVPLLLSFKVPVIVHLTAIGSGSGGVFVVLPFRDKTGVAMIDGATGRLISVIEDDLRRAWDGVVVVPEKESLGYYWTLSACALLAIMGVRISAGRLARPSVRKAARRPGHSSDRLSVDTKQKGRDNDADEE